MLEMKLPKILIIIQLILSVGNLQAQDNQYGPLWEKAQQLEAEDLTKSALEQVQTISEKAKKEKNSAQTIKALLFTSKYALTLEEDAQLKIIVNFKSEIENAAFPAKNVLESYLANLYWQYFQQNRYQFYNRTETETKIDSVDFRTWDLTTLFNEISFHFEASLHNKEKLQKTELNHFKEILHTQADSETYRPTLFDILAHAALDFYKTDENSINRPNDAFEIDKPQILCKANIFIKQKISAQNQTSLQSKALLLYQELLKFHLSDAEPKAFVDVDMSRLNFIHQYAKFPQKDSIYLAVLQNSVENFKMQPESGLYTYEIARLYTQQGNAYDPVINTHNRWEKKKALELCEAVVADFPKSYGANKCKSLKSQILASDLILKTEKIIPVEAETRMLVKYKNIDAIQFSALRITPKQFEQFGNLYRPTEQRDFFRKLELAKSWEASLKNEKDYQRHGTEVLLPKLDNGQYVILATPSDKNEGASQNKTFAFSIVQVTNLALVSMQLPDAYQFQVIDRRDGRPISGAKAQLSYRKNQERDYSEKTFTANENGIINIPSSKEYWSYITVTLVNENSTSVFGPYYIDQRYDTTGSTTDEVCFLFTDRSIYRPGQPLYFKGIAVLKNEEKSSILENIEVSVELQDVNHQTVATQKFKTNDYGSFSGEFILPDSGLTGNFSLQVNSTRAKLSGYTSFSVEEYKRPKFETFFAPITETFRVNDSITVKGSATAYAGSNITDAKVTYRIKRNAYFPQWYYWHHPYFNTAPQEITHGETVTDASGNYTIDFKALPDNSLSEESLPTFQYEVIADVTDINGETHTATRIVSVGYHALNASIGASDRMDKTKETDTLSITINNLNQQPVETNGTIKMYKLKAPDKVVRPRPWPAPDYKNWEKDAFENRFPQEAFATEDDPATWKKEELVWQSNFDTAKSQKIPIKLSKKWKSGRYLIELTTTDAFGQEVKALAQTIVYSDRDKKIADKQLFQISTDRHSYEIGDEVELKVASAAKNLTVSIFVEKDNKIVDTHIIELNDSSKALSIPVTSGDLGGFSINYTYAAFNSFTSGSLRISVPYPKTDLQIETMTFRDKLAPGTDETWAFTIKGPQGEKVSAELLANMYDASLDAFREHFWSFDPLMQPYYYSNIYTDASQSFGVNSFRTLLDNDVLDINLRYYDSFNWFQLNFADSYWFRQQNLRKNRNPSRAKFMVVDSIPEGIVKGIVMDNEGNPLPGANIVISGTSNGITSNFDGEFSLEVLEGSTLIYSYIGHKTFKHALDDYNFIKVYLAEDHSELNEVVSVGYTNKSGREPMAMDMTADESPLNQEQKAVISSTESEEDSLNINASGVEVVNTEEKDEKESLDQVQIRKNMKETAFFFPKLKTDKDGNVFFNFTTPEALTQWKLQLLAHTKSLESAITSLETVTQKELMVIPNAPRFLREGDEINISTKIVNLTNKTLSGEARLVLTDAVNNIDISKKLLSRSSSGRVAAGGGGQVDSIKKFQVDSMGNTQVSWRLKIPDGLQAVQYKIAAKAGNFSDGEQNLLPILTNRTLVTETLPMWVRSNGTKTFSLEKLKDNTSSTLQHHKLTLEITSNPAWYAVQALPYLMEYPYECNEQTFARYYANALASHIANSNPRIQEVFKQWAGSDTVISDLEKNEELKSLLIQETPWLRDAQNETEQKKRIGLLFNLDKMKNEKAKTLKKLKNNQSASGAWPWFDGGYDNRFITQHIITGIGHLEKLTRPKFDTSTTANHSAMNSGNGESKSPELTEMISRAIDYLDAEFVNEYEYLKSHVSDMATDHLSRTQIHYLYMRSFYPNVKTSKKVDEITSYYKNQARKYWNKKGLCSKGMLALTLYRMEDKNTSSKILRSLKENSITSEELGMYWKENKPSWNWNEAQIETQALMIETFGEIENDVNTIDNLKVWLLKNKQTNQWNTTKASTEAVYALLLQGSDWLPITDVVDVRVGGVDIEPSSPKDVQIEAGTGYYKTSWNANQIKPKMAEVQISKKGEGIAWGALYWQYFENLDKITTAETPLKLQKKLFLKNNTNTGEEISEITAKTDLIVGDLVRVRIELRADRDMEFIHMKDMRAAGFEPINVLSQYKRQDGLGYYESTKDASTNFFFDYLPKGIYVFEYDLRVNNAGDFSNGITTIQSMYAPEFSSHSEGVRVAVSGD